MQELIDKIKEYTIDGHPGVGQIIELSDIAKKHGVKKTELEKLIVQQLAAAKDETEPESYEENVPEVEIPAVSPEVIEPISPLKQENFTKPEYDRPDMDSARNSFEIEMKLRQEEERQKLQENKPTFEAPTFSQPDIVFPELNVSFGDDKKEQEEIVEQELPEIVQEEKVAETFEVPVFDAPEIKVEERINVSQEIPESKPFDSGIHFEPKKEEKESTLESDFSFSEDGVDIPSFEESLKNSRESQNKEDVLRKIIADNKAAKEKAERVSSANAKSKNTQTKSRPTPSSNADTVTLEKSNSAKITGIVSLVAAILPFPIIGIIAGVYGFNVAKKLKENIDANPSIYGSVITNNVNLGLYLSMAGAVIAGIRSLSYIF